MMLPAMLATLYVSAAVNVTSFAEILSFEKLWSLSC